MRTQVTPVAPQGGLGPQKGREAPTGAKRQRVAKRRLRVEGTRVRDTGRRGAIGTGADCERIPRSVMCARR